MKRLQVLIIVSVSVRVVSNFHNMKKTIVSIAVMCVGVFVLVAPSLVFAETSLAQLAQCSGEDCSACNVVYMANGLIKWLIGITFLLFAALFAIAGVRLVMSGGNHHALDEAKSSFVNAIIGLIIILSAWLIVDTIMRALVGTEGHEGQLATGVGSDGKVTGWLLWSEVTCQKQTEPDKYTEWENPDVQEYFTESGMNSYQAFVYNSARGCKQVASASFPDMAACQNALRSVVAGGAAYVIQDCSGSTGGSAPTWNSAPVCGGATTPGGAMTLTLKNGTSVPVNHCDPGSLTTVNFLGGSVQIHKNLAASVRRIDAAWRSQGGNSFYRVTSVGGYSCRNIAGTTKPSIHSYGLAIDINPAQNPRCPSSPEGQCPDQNIVITNMPPEFIRILRNEGWGWGGNWSSSKDTMHYSKASNEQGNMTGE